MNTMRRGSHLSIQANMQANALGLTKTLSGKASVADKEAYIAATAKALALQAKLQEIAKRIDQSSGSPVFTAEEHDEIQTLLGVTV